MALRSEESHQAILNATMALVNPEDGEGFSLQKLSIERIAREAGVSKTTIYRWWPSKVAVVIDSFLEHHVARTPFNEELPAVDSLRDHLGSVAEVYGTGEGRLVAQLIAECQHDPEAMKEFKDRFWLNRLETATSLIHRAQSEGVIRNDISSREIADILYAPIYFRLLLQSGPLDRDWAHSHFDIAMEGVRSRN
ncbi:TetR/AcrR family transcriptional regulator [Corynebacterium hylobatis]|uniref:TetR/AcrR family transcriptional regulator n=1 Tax=Corynebacterium hylobatis TaxID=1859290 RepID=A0A3R9ZJA9_9CORY|nr:TetR/AcrR family transcriptional regulator [Corynebacterium hylobatis]RSZ63867.1 TetR/AcrR family transcriptional regulator [Corynebacterium hylobatis]